MICAFYACVVFVVFLLSGVVIIRGLIGFCDLDGVFVIDVKLL